MVITAQKNKINLKDAVWIVTFLFHKFWEPKREKDCFHINYILYRPENLSQCVNRGCIT